MLEPSHSRHPERPTGVFVLLPHEVREGSFTDSRGVSHLRAFEVSDPQDPRVLKLVGIRLPFGELRAALPNWNVWREMMLEVGGTIDLCPGYLELALVGDARDPIDHAACDRMERVATFLRFNKTELPLVLPSGEAVEPLITTISPPFARVEDWKYGVFAPARHFAEIFYDETAFGQTPNHATIRLPSHIEPWRQVGDLADRLAGLAARHGIEAKVYDDLRVNTASDPPIPHLLGTTILLRVELRPENRDRRILSLVNFTNRVATRLFQADSLWQAKADGVRLGDIPGFGVPSFPLWCTQCPRELLGLLPFMPSGAHAMFNEEAGRAWVTAPMLRQADHVPAQRLIHAKLLGVDCYERTEGGVRCQCFSVSFYPQGRTRSMLRLLSCLSACFGGPNTGPGPDGGFLEGV